MTAGGRDRRATGLAAERTAAERLSSLGYTIVARNYRCPAGELDLVAKDGRTLVFVEVKGRNSRSHGSPEESVDARKRRRLWRAAEHFLAAWPEHEPVCRFDVVAVETLPGRPPQVRVVRDAFRGDGA